MLNDEFAAASDGNTPMEKEKKHVEVLLQIVHSLPIKAEVKILKAQELQVMVPKELLCELRRNLTG